MSIGRILSVGGNIRTHHGPTWLTLSASARCRAPSSPMWPPLRDSVVSVCYKKPRYIHTRRISSHSHLIDFQCISQTSCSDCTDSTWLELECGECLLPQTVLWMHNGKYIATIPSSSVVFSRKVGNRKSLVRRSIVWSVSDCWVLVVRHSL